MVSKRHFSYETALPSRNLFTVILLMEPHMNGTNLMNMSDAWPTITRLSLNLKQCYFYVFSTVSMLFVIINYKL